jgi:flagellar hook-associated protein 2
MSDLRLPGILSGIDTNTLIAQLMAIERRTLNMYEQRKSLWEEKKEALSSLETSLQTLIRSVAALSDDQELRAFTIASSDSDVLTAEASNSAFEGNHTVVINQLATAERWVHTSGLEYAEDYVGDGEAGTFIYSYNHKETVITTTATTTLEELVGLINNDANNPGVTAGLLYHNGAYHLVLNGNDAGSDYQISINAYNTEVWQAKSGLTVDSDNATLSTKIIDLDQFSGTLGTTDKITINGTDKAGNPIGEVELAVTSNTKITHLISEINDAFDGIAKATFVNGKIVFTDDTCGASDISISLEFVKDPAGDAALTLPADPIEDWTVTEGGTAGTLTDFEPADFSETQSAQDSKMRVDGYPSGLGIAEVQTLSKTNKATDGTFTLTYDGQTTAAIDRGASTAQIQDALEALSNVEAGDITVSGVKLRDDGDTIFTFHDTLGDVSMISIDTSNLIPSSGWTFSETTKGDDTNCWIRRSSNTVDDVISGVTLHLHDLTETGEEITLTRDISSVRTKLNAVVNAYNAVVAYIQERTSYNNDSKTAGVLMGDYTVSNVINQLRTPLIGQTSGFVEDVDAFLTPGHIGLELDKDGQLSLDANVFDEAIAQDYMDVLAIIGADKTGSSDSNTIEFYTASSDYTIAGTYDIEVEISSGAISSAKIKLSTESTYRDATYSNNIVTGNSTFNDNGDPVCPENGLQLSVDLSQDGTFTATVRVKQGFAGAIEDALDRMLKVTTGPLKIDQKYVDQTIENLKDKIDLEDYRLTQREARLVERFARLEKTLALLQSQMLSLGYSY